MQDFVLHRNDNYIFKSFEDASEKREQINKAIKVG